MEPAKIMDNFVSVSDFSQGKANKIFNNVADNNENYIVVKNNKPKAVIVSLQKYEEMRNDIKRLAAWIEEMEDNKLYVESMERIKNSKDEDLISMEDVVKEEGLDMKEIEKLADNVEIY